MPPKAASKEDKVKAVKGDQAEDIVLEYMKAVNRPYAVADVTANLKGKVTKLNVTKVLASLAEKGSLTVKGYGKQNIYVYNQALVPSQAAGEMEEVEQKRVQLKAGTDVEKKELKELLTTMDKLKAEPATKDLLPQIKKIDAENATTLKVLIPLREFAKDGGGQAVFTPEEAAKIEAEWTQWRKEFTSRKKIYNGFIDTLREGGIITDRTEFEETQGFDFEHEIETELAASELVQPPPPNPNKRSAQFQLKGRPAKK